MLSFIKSLGAKFAKPFSSLALSATSLFFLVILFFDFMILFTNTKVRALMKPLTVILFSKQNYKLDVDIGINAKLM